VDLIEDLITSSNLPGGVEAIICEKKNDLETASRILLDEFSKAKSESDQNDRLDDFLSFASRTSSNLPQG